MNWFLNLVVFCAIINCSYVFAANLINKKVDRTIDLTTQLTKITTKLIVENQNAEAANEYVMVIDNDHSTHLAHINAFLTIKGNQVPIKLNKINQFTYAIQLGDEHAIKPDSQSDLITVEQIYTNLQQPFPETIKQNGRQLVKYNGNHYYFSLYDTKTQQTKVKLPATGSIESFSKLKSTQIDRTIHYGPYENIKKLSESPLQVHHENNSPFLVVSKLDRKIELSPWFDVARIEDTIDIYHNGAKLDGSFSRFDYQKDQSSGLSAVNALRTKINRKAKHIYYRDEIGNISSSDVRPFREDLIVTLKPRFPLFGGWKTYYKLGYQLPLDEVVGKNGDHSALRVNFIDHIYDNLVIEDATVKIILPEGASVVKVQPPYDVEQLPTQVKLTYLDLKGRTILTFKKQNLVEDHIQEIEIVYDYNPIWKLQEPALIFATFVLFAIVLYVYSKLNFSLDSKRKEKVN